MRWTFTLIALLPLLVPVLRPDGVAPTAAVVRDRRSALFLEDAVVPRPIARVTAELIERGGVRRARVAVSALGPGVEPLPGLEGVAGANLRTAEELDRLLREAALQLVVRSAGESLAGRRIAVRWAAVPVCRIGDDGAIDFAARTAREWPVEVTFESPALPSGETWCYLEADGVPRLAVEIAGDRIVAIESLAARPPTAEVGR
ncbi:MAG: hypothetical protein KDE27_00565 [Planctomycetes bacterium]|nr:hypothetical protein [Planctomycetota bacterium]